MFQVRNVRIAAYSVKTQTVPCSFGAGSTVPRLADDDSTVFGGMVITLYVAADRYSQGPWYGLMELH